ncbi:MAG: alpha-galactosidase, partial [Ruminococcaceae bacterium]|nr:alpha-galactosidase [Oscillospiraceae bacterium]
GLNYVLAPGEELTLPAILYYEFYNKLDLDAYRLHRYCNDTYPARSMPVIYNTWLSRFDDISYDILAQQLDYVKRLGAEYFVIDAGWFGPPHTWSASVGDWEECKTASMAGRMREFSDLVRAKGLKFGLWFEPERATRMARAPKEHPDYYFFEGSDYFLDFGNPEAWEYIYDIVTTRIRQYGIEFIKFDFNAEMTYDRRGEAFIPYFRGYKKFVAAIRKEFPDIYLENCASGGERMTMSSLFDGFDSFWASDNHSIYKQVEMYRSNLMYMPSRAIEKWVTVQSMKDFGPVYGNYEKYSDPIIGCAEAAWRNVEGLTRDYLMTAIQGGPLGFSCDLTRWSERLLADMSAFVAAYKEERAFWMRSECHVLCATESVLALQFNDEEFRKIKLCVFLDKPIQYEFNVHPFCDCDATFVTEDGRELDAQTLCHEGISFGSWDRFCGVTVTLNRK